MTNIRTISINDLLNGRCQIESQLVSLEGYLVSSGQVEVVDDPAAPRAKVLVENLSLDDLLEKSPERLRLGGRFIWEEKARTTGILYADSGNWKIKDVQTIDLLDIGESLKFD